MQQKERPGGAAQQALSHKAGGSRPTSTGRCGFPEGARQLHRVWDTARKLEGGQARGPGVSVVRKPNKVRKGQAAHPPGPQARPGPLGGSGLRQGPVP